MNRRAGFLVGATYLSFTIALSALFSINPTRYQRMPQPQDSGTMVVDKSKYKIDGTSNRERRIAFFEQIHLAAPDVDWRAMDRAARLEKYRNRNIDFNSKSSVESFANGAITGLWDERGSLNQTGRTHIADYDTATGKIYVGTSGGNIWRGNKDGTGWEVLNEKLRFEHIVMLRIARKGNQRRIMATSGGKQFFYSDDDGLTWNTASGLDNIAQNGFISRGMLLDDENRTVLLLLEERISGQTHTSVYRSNDFGNSFYRMQSFPVSQFGNIDSWDLWAPYYTHAIAFLQNNGRTYEIDLENNQVNQLGTLPGNNNGLTMLTGNVADGTVNLYCYVDRKMYKSHDGGQNWVYVNDLPRSPFFKISFSASATIKDRLYFGEVECFSSSDAGFSWTRVNEWGEYYDMPQFRLHADIPSVNALLDENGNEFLLINTDGGLYVSYNQLQMVINLSMSGLNISQYYSSYTCKFDTRYIYLGSQDQGYQRTNQGNQLGPRNYTQIISGDYGHLTSGDEGGTIWTVYPGFAMYFPDALNSNPTAFYDFPQQGQNMLWLAPIMADPINVNIAYLAGGSITGTGSYIIRLVALGNDISATQLPFNFRTASGGGTLSALATSPLDPNYWYAMTTNGRFFYSEDYGQTWTAGNSGMPAAHYFYGNCIVPSKVNLGEVYICGSGYSNPGVYRSLNNGQTFTPMAQGLPNTMIYRMDISTNDEFLFAATELGPYVFAKGQSQWFDLAGTHAPDQVYWNVEFVEPIQTARFVTYGRGVWDFKIESGLSASSLLAGTTQLQVFPNPTRDYVQIQSREPMQEITIYDLNGKAYVRKRPNNAYEITLVTSHLRSGMYIVEARSHRKRFSHRLVVK
ncbi:MAG: T9SS type A sorting domain-containing protein [Flavobacteriales bacterium]